MLMRKSWNRMLSMLLSVGLVLSMVIGPASVWASDEGEGGASEKIILEHGFEGSTEGWQGRGDSVVSVSEDVYRTGTSSLKSTGASDNWHGSSLDVLGLLESGGKYEISLYVRLADPADEPGSLKLTMNSIGAGEEAWDQLVVSNDVSASDWTELKAEYTVPKDISMLNLIVESADGAKDAITPDHYIDNVKIIELAPPSDDFTPIQIAHYGFETDQDGWHSRGSATVGRTTEAAYEGDYSLKVTSLSQTWEGVQIDARSILQRTAEYKISAYVRPVSTPSDPVTMKLSMQRTFEGEDTGWDTVAQQDGISDTDWTILEGTYSYDKSASELTLYVEASVAGSEETVDFYVDYVVIEMTRAPDVAGLTYDFEDGELGDWFGRFNEEVLTVTDEDAHSGNYSLKVEAGDANRAAMLDVTDFIVPGVSYQVTVWVKLAPGQEDTAISLSVEQISDGESTYQWLEGNKTVTSDEWVRFRGNYAMTSGVDTVRMYIETQETSGVFYIDEFSLLPVQQQKEIQRDIPSLKDVFEDYFEIGAAIESKHMAGLHGEMLEKHYNVIVAENVMKPDAIQPSEGNFNWAQADAMFDYAEANGMKVRFHTLVWHSQAPDWMFLDESGSDMAAETDLEKREANKELLMKRMKDHITAVVQRYKDRVDSWDVVNEVISDGGGMRTFGSKWWEIFESDIFITEAFRLVRDLDPDAKLYINDYNTHINAKRDTLYEKVVEWLDAGVPIDGVGHQTHINYISPSMDSIIESIRMFGELGLDNQITELDVSIYADDFEAFQDFADIPQDRLIDLAYRYKELFDALKALDEEGDYISQVIFWGIADDHTWLHNRGTTRVNAPFVFDHELQAKDAYWAIVDPSKLPVLAQNLTTYKGTPTIDGNRDLEWDLVSWTEAGDGASFKLLWDDSNLYVLTEFEDLTPSYLDKVEVYVGNAKYSLKRDGSDAAGANYKVKELADRYRLEAQLPLTDAVQGQTVNFDIRFTDNRLSEPISWNDLTHSQDEHRGNFGILTLQDMPKVYTATKGTPDIDAVQEELWDVADTLTTDVWVEGANGATAQVKVLWDDDHLYLLADVEDSLLSVVSTQAHEQDSIEIFVDQNYARTTSYQGDDGQYRVNYENVRSYNGRASADNFETAAVETSEGYLIEAAITLDPGVAKNGAVIGFDIQVNDDANGDGVRDSVAIWHDPTGNSYQNTSSYGILVLEDPDADPIDEDEVERPITDYPPTDDDGNRGGGSPIFISPNVPRFNVENGVVNVTVDGSDASRPIEVSNHIVRDALDQMVGSILRIQLNLPSGAEQSATVQIPLADVMADGADVDRIDIAIGGATVSISASEIDGVLSDGSRTLTLTVREVDQSTLPEDVHDRLSGFPVYEFELKVDGVAIDQFSGGQSVTVRMAYDLQPGQKQHQIVVYYIEDDGQLTVVRNARYDVQTGEIRFSPSHFSRYGASIAKVEFTDMNQAAWATTIVEALASREVVQGVGEGRFDPQRSVTRAEFTQMLMHALDLVQTGTTSSFTDVESGAWYADAVATAEQLGIVNGRGDGTFGLHDRITREDMAVIAYRALQAIDASACDGDNGLTFEDQDMISNYAREAIAKMNSAGLITGYPDGSFQPKHSTTRAEAAAVIYRILGLE